MNHKVKELAVRVGLVEYIVLDALTDSELSAEATKTIVSLKHRLDSFIRIHATRLPSDLRELWHRQVAFEHGLDELPQDQPPLGLTFDPFAIARPARTATTAPETEEEEI